MIKNIIKFNKNNFIINNVNRITILNNNFNNNRNKYINNYFCTTTTATTTPNVNNSINDISSCSNISIIINKDEKLKQEDEDENEDIQCISEKCSIIFKIPNKLRGGEGYCPKCSNKMQFKKHTSNYKRILKKRREKYLNTLHEEIKTINSFDPIKNKPFGLSVILEDCRSLHNVGSVFRTSDGAGFNHIYLCGLTGHPPNDQISKSSLGSEDMVNWSFSNDTIGVIRKLKELNVKIIGIEQTEKSIPLLDSLDKIENLVKKEEGDDNNQTSYHPITIIMGNEVAGLSNEAIELCDLICDLPMKGNKRSLNVSITYGIVSYILSNHFKSLSINTTSKK